MSTSSSKGGSAPVKVELTAVEAQGYNMAGNAPDDGIESQILLVLSVGGMDEPTRKFMAEKLTAAAKSARQKIIEATRFEIVVLTPPKPSTLLKPKPKKTAKKKAAKPSPKSSPKKG